MQPLLSSSYTGFGTSSLKEVSMLRCDLNLVWVGFFYCYIHALEVFEVSYTGMICQNMHDDMLLTEQQSQG